jgi:3-dehydroquinate synthetase
LEDPIDPDRILAAMRNDKKARGGSPQFVLLEGIGRPVVRGDIPEAMIRNVYESLFV